MSKFSQFNFGGKKALVRVDFNVPLNENFQITDDTRMRAAIPTIQKVLQDGGSVILSGTVDQGGGALAVAGDNSEAVRGRKNVTPVVRSGGRQKKGWSDEERVAILMRSFQTEVKLTGVDKNVLFSNFLLSDFLFLS